jgi:hypothetical protein
MNTAMNEIDKYLQFKGFYITMDNSAIHKKNGELSLFIESRRDVIRGEERNITLRRMKEFLSFDVWG